MEIMEIIWWKSLIVGKRAWTEGEAKRKEEWETFGESFETEKKNVNLKI